MILSYNCSKAPFSGKKIKNTVHVSHRYKYFAATIVQNSFMPAYDPKVWLDKDNEPTKCCKNTLFYVAHRYVKQEFY